MVRLIGQMVTRDEAHRFLDWSLACLTTLCDDVAVWDDRSTDATVDVVRQHTTTVGQRGLLDVGFEEHEGFFRDQAWEYMESTLEPESGDWILSVDADEIVLVDDRAALIDHLEATDSEALSVRIHELWQLRPPMERVDGHWGSITGARLYRWRPGQHIAARDMGCGSVPPVTQTGLGRTTTLSIAHLGYVRAEDREAKHARYSNRRGHSATHVASILKTPTLQPLGADLAYR